MENYQTNQDNKPFVKKYKNLIYVFLIIGAIWLIYWYGTISAVQKECICNYDYQFDDIKLVGGNTALIDYIVPISNLECNEDLMKIFDSNTKEMSFVCNNNEAWLKIPYYKGNMTFYYVRRSA